MDRLTGGITILPCFGGSLGGDSSNFALPSCNGFRLSLKFTDFYSIGSSRYSDLRFVEKGRKLDFIRRCIEFENGKERINVERSISNVLSFRIDLWMESRGEKGLLTHRIDCCVILFFFSKQRKHVCSRLYLPKTERCFASSKKNGSLNRDDSPIILQQFAMVGGS